MCITAGKAVLLLQELCCLQRAHRGPSRIPTALIACGSFSQLDQRARQPSFGAIEEEPQAESLGAFDGHKAHLTANMVDVIQPVQLRFVVIGVAVQSRDAFLNGLTEPRTDLESILGGALSGHDEHLGAGMPEAEILFARGLKFFLLLPILPKHPSLRQITASRNFSNDLSENKTVVNDQFFSCRGRFTSELRTMSPELRVEV